MPDIKVIDGRGEEVFSQVRALVLEGWIQYGQEGVCRVNCNDHIKVYLVKVYGYDRPYPPKKHAIEDENEIGGREA
jgi:hypothetical protein